jgi:hypothetical protein
MKRLFGIVIGVAASLATVACSTEPGRVDPTNAAPDAEVSPIGSPKPDESLPGQVYSSEDGGFTFHYPDGWHVRTRGAGVVVYPARTLKASPANVSVSAIHLPAPMTLKGYFSQDMTLLQTIPGFKLLDVMDETFADEPAFAVSYVIATKVDTSRSLQYTTVVEDEVYAAIYTSIPANYRQYFVEAGLIVRTFRLL